MIGGVIRLGAALAMTLVTAFMFWAHSAIQKQVEAGINASVARASLTTLFFMPFLLSIEDVSSFVLLIPALDDIAVSPEELLGDRADRPMQAIYRFTLDNQFRIAGVVALVMTIYLVISGVLKPRPQIRISNR